MIESPGWSVSLFHPLCSRSIGLSISTAQFITPLASFTFMNTCTCGLRQSTSVTTPLIVVGFLSSNLAEIA